MIDIEPTTLEVGSTAYVWARITERTSQDLTGVTFEVATVDPSGTVSAWAAPDATDTELAAAGIVRVAVLHEATVPGYWRLKVRITDNPETIVDTAGAFRVI